MNDGTQHLRIRVAEDLDHVRHPRVEVLDQDDHVLGDLSHSVEAGGVTWQMGGPDAPGMLTIKLACEHAHVGTIEIPGHNAPSKPILPPDHLRCMATVGPRGSFGSWRCELVANHDGLHATGSDTTHPTEWRQA